MGDVWEVYILHLPDDDLVKKKCVDPRREKNREVHDPWPKTYDLTWIYSNEPFVNIYVNPFSYSVNTDHFI